MTFDIPPEHVDGNPLKGQPIAICRHKGSIRALTLHS